MRPPRLIRRLASSLALALAAISSNVPAAEPVRPTSQREMLLGVVEDFIGAPRDYIPHTRVRAAFRREGGQWHPLPDGLQAPNDEQSRAAGQRLRQMIPRQVRWTICFDGRSRGTLETVLPESWGARARGTYILVPGQAEPRWAGQRRREFMGWPQAPVYRPMVACAGCGCADPDRWKRVELDRDALLALLPSLRRAMPSWLSLRNQPEKYISLRKAYGAMHGDRLVFLSFGEEDMAGYMFLARSDGSVSCFGGGKSLVDAGDYDGDGKSEVLVMSSGDDGDGYILFDSRLEELGRFSWTWEKGG